MDMLTNKTSNQLNKNLYKSINNTLTKDLKIEMNIIKSKLRNS